MGRKKNERKKQLGRREVRQREETREKGKHRVLFLDRALADPLLYQPLCQLTGQDPDACFLVGQQGKRGAVTRHPAKDRHPEHQVA